MSTVVKTYVELLTADFEAWYEPEETALRLDDDCEIIDVEVLYRDGAIYRLVTVAEPIYALTELGRELLDQDDQADDCGCMKVDPENVYIQNQDDLPF